MMSIFWINSVAFKQLEIAVKDEGLSGMGNDHVVALSFVIGLLLIPLVFVRIKYSAHYDFIRLVDWCVAFDVVILMCNWLLGFKPMGFKGLFEQSEVIGDKWRSGIDFDVVFQGLTLPDIDSVELLVSLIIQPFLIFTAVLVLGSMLLHFKLSMGELNWMIIIISGALWFYYVCNLPYVIGVVNLCNSVNSLFEYKFLETVVMRVSSTSAMLLLLLLHGVTFTKAPFFDKTKFVSRRWANIANTITLPSIATRCSVIFLISYAVAYNYTDNSFTDRVLSIINTDLAMLFFWIADSLMVKQVTSTLITTAGDSVANVSSFESRVGKAARANLGGTPPAVSAKGPISAPQGLRTDPRYHVQRARMRGNYSKRNTLVHNLIKSNVSLTKSHMSLVESNRELLTKVGNVEKELGRKSLFVKLSALGGLGLGADCYVNKGGVATKIGNSIAEGLSKAKIALNKSKGGDGGLVG